MNTVTGLIRATGGPLEHREGRSVLITGGRGFIGRAVGKLLRRSRYRVISVDREAASEGGGEIVCDICDAAGLQSLFETERIAAIIHLAAILPTEAQREPGLATRINVHGSLQLLEMARRFGVGRLVFASSLSVYGTCPADRAVSELDAAAPEDLYGVAKLYVERLGVAYQRSHGLEFVSLRIGRVVGPGAKSVSSAWRTQIFEALGAKQPAEIVLPYAAAERILLVHVDDVAAMLVNLLQASGLAHAVYNAPCESMVVGDLRRCVEGLNSNVSVKLGNAGVIGNPRWLDSSRFAQEFKLQTEPIFERLQKAVDKDTR